MKKREQLFDHPTQLNRLSTLPLIRRAGDGRLRLAGEIADHPERERWEKELNRHYYACGCAEGSQGLLLGLLAGAGYAAWAYAGGDWSAGRLILTALAIAVAASAVGKFAGLLRAQAKLRRTVKEIQSAWKVPPGEFEENAVCG